MSVISDKSNRFAESIVDLYKGHGSDFHLSAIYKQLLRSGTSIGANIAEAKYAQSNADYISKFQIALKEASETRYWLNLLHNTNLLSDNEYEENNNACEELIKMLSSSIKTLKQK